MSRMTSSAIDSYLTRNSLFKSQKNRLVSSLATHHNLTPTRESEGAAPKAEEKGSSERIRTKNISQSGRQGEGMLTQPAQPQNEMLFSRTTQPVMRQSGGLRQSGGIRQSSFVRSSDYFQPGSSYNPMRISEKEERL